MEPEKIITADLLDLLFEGKNKSYGAYELRRNYKKRLWTSLVCMALTSGLFFFTRLSANRKKPEMPAIAITDLYLKDLEKVKEQIPKVPVVRRVQPVAAKVATTIFTPPLLVKQLDPADQPPAIAELDQVQIGLIDQQGINNSDFTAPPVEHGTGDVAPFRKESEDYTRIFTKVEKEARFPGGLAAWKRYLERNLNSNTATDDGAPVGYYTVRVKFLVDRDGMISNVTAIEIPAACPSCAAEAVRVIEKGPKWEPAVQNGRMVNYEAVQLVTFQVVEQ